MQSVGTASAGWMLGQLGFPSDCNYQGLSLCHKALAPLPRACCLLSPFWAFLRSSVQWMNVSSEWIWATCSLCLYFHCCPLHPLLPQWPSRWHPLPEHSHICPFACLNLSQALKGSTRPSLPTSVPSLLATFSFVTSIPTIPHTARALSVSLLHHSCPDLWRASPIPPSPLGSNSPSSKASRTTPHLFPVK